MTKPPPTPSELTEIRMRLGANLDPYNEPLVARAILWRVIESIPHLQDAAYMEADTVVEDHEAGMNVSENYPDEYRRNVEECIRLSGRCLWLKTLRDWESG